MEGATSWGPGEDPTRGALRCVHQGPSGHLPQARPLCELFLIPWGRILRQVSANLGSSGHDPPAVQ